MDRITREILRRELIKQALFMRWSPITYERMRQARRMARIPMDWKTRSALWLGRLGVGAAGFELLRTLYNWLAGRKQ